MTKKKTLEERIERVADSGNLLANLQLIKPGSWQTAAEVFKAWNEDGVPDEGVITANLGVYRVDENGEAVFELLGRGGNPFTRKAFREEAYHGIFRNDFFLPQGEMKEQIKAAPKVTIHYSGLTIKTDGCDSKSGYVEFDGKNTDEERTLFEAVYGTANPGNGKRVYLLRECVVKVQLQNKPDELIARACYLNNEQNFITYYWNISSYDSAVRGVRRKAA